MLRLIIIVNILFFQTLFVFGQEKYEKEIRIKDVEVPENAKNIVKIFTKSKVKWYLEINADSIKTYEAKFKKNKKPISIEFDSNGMLLDVEVKIKEKNIADSISNQINRIISSKYKKYKIIKIQEQYIGNATNIYSSITENKKINVVYNYEIVAIVKNNGEAEMREFLFNSLGNLLSDKKIIFKNTVNLEF